MKLSEMYEREQSIKDDISALYASDADPSWKKTSLRRIAEWAIYTNCDVTSLASVLKSIAITLEDIAEHPGDQL